MIRKLTYLFLGFVALVSPWAAPSALAGTDLNEVAALLVYPSIIAIPGQETFVTVTNAGSAPVVAHVSYINGDPRPKSAGGAGYCYECDFSIPLSGNDTETLVVTSGPGGTSIQSEDTALSLSCPYPYGMIVISLEDGLGNVLTDNVLIGEEVVVDYAGGSAYSIPAIAIQGRNGGNGDHAFDFDDQEYSRLPRIVASNFLAPNLPTNPQEMTADVVLFTLGFERQYPPRVDCAVVGYDADEHPFSGSFQFGCWGIVDLCDISPEFCYPNLGLYGNYDTHGWFLLNCRVDQENNGSYEAKGGVHGALIQSVAGGTVIQRDNPSAPAMASRASWAHLLYQSVTTGDSVRLQVGAPGGSLE